MRDASLRLSMTGNRWPSAVYKYGACYTMLRKNMTDAALGALALAMFHDVFPRSARSSHYRMEGSMATKLNQIIAVEKGVKSETYSKLTDLHQAVQKAPLLSGIARTYRPKDEEGDPLPPESTRVQINTEKALQDIAGVMTRLFDVVATKDWTNCTAKANIVVGGQVLLNDVPTTYLLFLEKQLADMHTFVKKLPTLDPAEAWEYDQAADCWATKPV